MKRQTIIKAALALALLQLNVNTSFAQDTTVTAQEKPKKDKRPVKDVFDGGTLVNNQTAVVPTAKTLEFMIQHRFGLVGAEEFDMGGLYAPSNIRMGFNYTINDRIQLGIGSTKNNKLQDLNWKVALLKQTRSGSIPVFITYYGNVAIDIRKDAFPETTNRLSYFHELIIARKFTKAFSLQVAPSISHFNMVDSLVKHDNIALAVSARYKITEALAIMVEYNRNFTAQNEEIIKVQPNISIGLEATTSAHVFQVFVTSGQSIIQQHNVLYNTNDFTKMKFCIGFNMTRLWNF
jgi:hypothetical protein